MNKNQKITELRTYLSDGQASVGSWMQIGSSEIAEIMSSTGLPWVAVDLEHGSIGVPQLPDIFRALELNGTLPFVRLASSYPSQAVRALDAGAAGIIAPNIESWNQLRDLKKSIQYPPTGKRGVGYCRGNTYGVNFDEKLEYNPFLVAMIESQTGVNNITTILDEEPDAVLIGPYDLSASFNITGQFESYAFKEIVKHIKDSCQKKAIPVGVHVVNSSLEDLNNYKSEGYTFLPFGMDTTIISDKLEMI